MPDLSIRFCHGRRSVPPVFPPLQRPRRSGRDCLLAGLSALVLGLALGPGGTLAGGPGDDDQEGNHGSYYLVRSARILATATDLTVHDRRGSTHLVSATEDAVARLAAHGCDLARLPAGERDLEVVLEAARSDRQPLRSHSLVSRFDPAVQALVDQVTWSGIAEKIAWLESFQTRYSYSPQSFAAADGIGGFFVGLGLTAILQPFSAGGTTLYNVHATQLGTAHPDSIFIIGAHYDSVSEDPMTLAPGADDNASGVAAVLTAAEILTEHPCRYTIRYVCFGGEEQGLLGSEYYAHQAAVQGDAIVGMLNFDMLGWWEEGVDFDLEIEYNQASQWLAFAISSAADLYTDMPYELHFNNGAWWGDHFSFWLNGYAAVNHEESYDWGDPDFNPHYHTTQDLLVHLDPDFTAGNVKIAVAALASLAQLDEVTQVAGPVSLLPEPAEYSLAAHPSPFNGQVVLKVSAQSGVAQKLDVTVGIHDLRGRCIATLPVTMERGQGCVSWNGRNMAAAEVGSGVYFCRLLEMPELPPLKVVYVK